MTLKERILKEMLVDSDVDWALTKEIYNENKDNLRPGIGLSNIYLRIKELRKSTHPPEKRSRQLSGVEHKSKLSVDVFQQD